MSDEIPGTGLVVGVGTAGTIVGGLLSWLLKRTVSTEDKRVEKLESRLDEMIGKVASLRDDVTRLQEKNDALRDRMVLVERQAKAAHVRLDQDEEAAE